MQFSVRDWMMDLVVFIDPDSTVLEALADHAPALYSQPDSK